MKSSTWATIGWVAFGNAVVERVVSYSIKTDDKFFSAIARIDSSIILLIAAFCFFVYQWTKDKEQK